MVHVRTAQLTQADGGRWTLSTAPRRGDDSRWFVEDVDGWYGGSGLRGGATPSYNHGTFLSRGFREGRTLTLHGWVENVDADTRDWQERNISGMLWDGMTGELTCDDGNAVMTTRVRLDGPPQVVPLGVRDLQFQVPLVSESPFLYGDWREFSLDPPGVGVGFEFPPFSGGSMAVGENLIGDPESPEVRDLFGGHQWEWNAGGYWTRPAVSGGTTQFNAYPSSSTAYSYMPLIPGKTYRVSFDAWVDVADAEMRARTAVYYKKTDESTAFVGDGEIGNDTLVSGEWVHVERFWTAPEDAASGSFAPQLLDTADEATEVRIKNPQVELTEPIITFGTERVRGEHFVWNDGNADSHPRFTVHADSPGGFSVGLADRLVTYPWPTYADVPVTVDMEGALFVGGRDQTHLLHERNWSKVPPRAIDTPVFRFLQGGRGFCTVAHRDTYI